MGLDEGQKNGHWLFIRSSLVNESILASYVFFFPPAGLRRPIHHTGLANHTKIQIDPLASCFGRSIIPSGTLVLFLLNYRHSLTISANLSITSTMFSRAALRLSTVRTQVARAGVRSLSVSIG